MDAQSAWLQNYSAAMGIADPARTFFVYIAFVMVFPIAAYAILTVLRLRSAETSGVAEIILARPVPRLAWAAAQIVAALAGSAVLLVILGGTLAISAPGIPGLWTLCLSLIPAVWVIVAITVLALGILPRWTTTIAWITLGIAGEILVKSGLPDIVLLATSPIAHVTPTMRRPRAPGSSSPSRHCCSPSDSPHSATVICPAERPRCRVLYTNRGGTRSSSGTTSTRPRYSFEVTFIDP
ncbi:hypothetical protein [Brevibacterium picturae]